MLTLPQVIEWWDEITEHSANLAAIRELCLEDRYFLLVQICGRHDMLHPWIYQRCREVEHAPDGYLDLWGREHYKSTIITFGGVIQELLRNPELRIAIFSHTRPIATAFLRSIKRELESNTALKQLFPDILYKDPQREAPMWGIETGITVKRRSNAKEASVEAWGLVDGQPTAKHFSLLVYDDVVTRESVSTPEQVQKTTEAWELSDNLGSEGGRRWMVGTRYSYADTYEAIIGKGAAKPRLHPATIDGTPEGRPVLFDALTWEQKKRDQGPATIACQMLQNPLAGSQRMFDLADLRVYEVRPETLNVYITVDPARSRKRDSDDTALIVTGIDYALNKYLLDGYAHQMDLAERWRRVRELYLRWTRASGVQSVFVGYEKYGADADLDYMRERMAADGPYFDILELAWPREGEGSKVDRVQRLGPDFRGGHYHLPYDTDVEWLRDGVNVKKLTTLQQKMLAMGFSYRIARPIRRKDHQGKMYDLTQKLREQIHYFPYAGKKDAIDAASRVYDMEPRAPAIIAPQMLEPEEV
jgi:hypothetical protein